MSLLLASGPQWRRRRRERLSWCRVRCRRAAQAAPGYQGFSILVEKTTFTDELHDQIRRSLQVLGCHRTFPTDSVDVFVCPPQHLPRPVCILSRHRGEVVLVSCRRTCRPVTGRNRDSLRRCKVRIVRIILLLTEPFIRRCLIILIRGAEAVERDVVILFCTGHVLVLRVGHRRRERWYRRLRGREEQKRVLLLPDWFETVGVERQDTTFRLAQFHPVSEMG